MQNNEASVQGRAGSASNTRRDWIILGVLLAAGILTLPSGGDASTVIASQREAASVGSTSRRHAAMRRAKRQGVPRHSEHAA